MFRNLLTRKGSAFETIDASRELLSNRPDCTGKVAVLGFCMGGGFALIAAAKGALQAWSVNYGLVPKDADELLRRACPIVGSFGAHDLTLKGAAMRLNQSLEKGAISHDVKEYADTGHASMNIHTGFRGWLVARLGMSFHEPSARDAQRRLLTFFEAHRHEHPSL
jgi:carboxymethylenebutenolidase